MVFALPTGLTVHLVWTALLAAGVAAFACPWGRRLAWAIGAVDRPSARKVHQHATARLGGFSAVLALVSCLTLWVLLDPTAIDQLARYWGLLPGAMILFGLGLWDDVYRVRPTTKLLIQCLAASIIWFGGIRLEILQLPLIGVVDLGAAGPFLTVLWIVGVTNAINFLDGLDGLAAGTAALASSSFLLISGYAALGSLLGLLSMVVTGTSLVLIVNNFRSPKLFLGDSGSLLLGGLIGSMAILTAKLAPGSVSAPPGAARLFLPIIVLAVPLIDMCACIVRRVLVGRSVFSADRGHIHHMLISFGLSPAAAAGVLCAATALLGIIAVVQAQAPLWTEPAVLGLLVVGSLIVYRWFGYLSLDMWLHCRRANKILARLIAQVCDRNRSRTRARLESFTTCESKEQRLDRVLNGIRRARRTLGIDYVLVQENNAAHRRQERSTPILELGRRTDQVVTSQLYACGRGETAGLTISLGEGDARQPARIHAKELLLMPFLLELASTVGLGSGAVRTSHTVQ